MPRTRAEVNASEDEASHSTREITLKNKKSDILDALNAALEREKKLKENRYDPINDKKKNDAASAVAETRQNIETNIFSEELNQKFKKLEDAIVAEETKLSELYGIEKEMNDLATAMSAKEIVLEKLEAEKTARIAELEAKISALEEDYVEKARTLELNRKREQEEYEYQKKRTREQDNDEWNLAKAEREKLIADKEAETLSLLKEAEEKSAHLADLERRVATFADELAKEYSRGRSEAAKDIERENKFATEMLKKDYQNKIDRQIDTIEYLKQELVKASKEKDTALTKLDQAYAEIKELATRTVEATGGVKILGNESRE